MMPAVRLEIRHLSSLPTIAYLLGVGILFISCIQSCNGQAIYIYTPHQSVEEGNPNDKITAIVEICLNLEEYISTDDNLVGAISTVSDSADETDDFIPVEDRAVIIPAGQKCKTEDIMIVSDMTVEGNEIFIVKLTASGTHTIFSNADTVYITIANDDDDTVPPNTPPVISNCRSPVPVVTSRTFDIAISWTLPQCFDSEDGNISPSCTPVSGSYFSSGVHSVRCECTDMEGLSDYCSINVEVIHNSAPTISNCSSPAPVITSQSTGIVQWTTPTCSEESIIASCNRYSGASYHVGIRSVTCTCTDLYGSIVSCSFAIQVIYNTAPSISGCPSPAPVITSTPTANITWTAPVCYDAQETSLISLCSHTSGRLFNVGITLVNCTCTDTYGAIGDCSFNVQVNTPCTSNPCQNEGTCSHFGDSFTCRCVNGFTGLHCSQDIKTAFKPSTYTVTEEQLSVGVSVCQAPFNQNITGFLYTIDGSAEGDVDFVEISAKELTIAAGHECNEEFISILPDENPELSEVFEVQFLLGSSIITATITIIDDDKVDTICMDTDCQYNSNCTSIDGSSYCQCIGEINDYLCLKGIAGVSFSKVNPFATIEMSCISEGFNSGEFGVSFGMHLSKNFDDLIQETPLTPITGDDALMHTFSVENVTKDSILFCLLLHHDVIVARYNVTRLVYVLPVFNMTPSLQLSTNVSLIIIWTAWRENIDSGDGPVISYMPYYKDEIQNKWMSGPAVSASQKLQFTAVYLKQDTNYTFSIAAVREGDRGEGPMGPTYTVKTKCNVPEYGPQNVQAIFTPENKINVSWQLPDSDDINCSIGIAYFTVYYTQGESMIKPAGKTETGSISSYIIQDMLEDGMKYSFTVSWTTDNESVQSKTTESSTLLFRSFNHIEGSRISLIAVFIAVPVSVTVILLIIILLAIFLFRRHCMSAPSKPQTRDNDTADILYCSRGLSGDAEDYIALRKKAVIEPRPHKHLGQTMTDYYTVNYEKSVLPVPIPSQNGVKIPEDNISAYEDTDNINSEYARGLPTIPMVIEQKRDGNSYKVPDFRQKSDQKRSSIPVPIQVKCFISYMTKIKKDRNSIITQEYMILPTGKLHTWTTAMKRQNKLKNYFKDNLPYDHTRVKLNTSGNDAHSDYYNANYIKDHQRNVAFIAAQGPRDDTADDFWRMVWQEDVNTIVMVTDVDQTNKQVLSSTYWPSNTKSTEVFGTITVALMDLKTYHTHTMRTFNVFKANEKLLHTIRHVQIHGWAYEGVPAQAGNLIALIKEIKLWNNEGTKTPLVVHCRNGIGATGIFISLYCLMEVLNNNEDISVFNFVRQMRKSRINMVQTQAQYMFIYDTLVEAHLSPDYEIPYDQLRKLDTISVKRHAYDEFQKLQMLRETYNLENNAVGNLPENDHKNRYADITPLNEFRPLLKSMTNSFRSNDYVNASYIQGFGSTDIIMTQSPLVSTVEDFWRLVYDYSCSIIIMLNDKQSNVSEVQYWPENQRIQCSSMTVICTNTIENNTFVWRQFQVSHQQSEKPIDVDHFAFNGWSKEGPNISKLTEFIADTSIHKSGPIIVHCKNGVGLSSIFVVVKSIMERSQMGNVCDVFQTVTALRKKNPYAIQTKEEYTFCYEILKCYLDSPDDYDVVY